MTADPGTLALIARHLILAVRPLRVAVSDVDQFKRYMYRLGWRVTSLPPEYSQIAELVSAAEQALEATDSDPSVDYVLALLSKVKAAYDAIKAISVAPPGVDAAAFLAEIGERLFELLWIDYLVSALPAAYNLFQMVDVIQIENIPAAPGRPAFIRTHFKWNAIPEILGDPLSLAARVYGWGTPQLASFRG